MSTSELPRINSPAGAVEIVPSRASLGQPAGESMVWTAAAPDNVVKRYLAGEDEKAWRAWRKHLLRRRSPLAGTPFETLGAAQFLLWGLSEEHSDNGQLAVIAPLCDINGVTNEARQRVLQDIVDNAVAPLDQRGALVLLACVYELPALAQSASETLWWTLVAQLRRTAIDAEALDVTAAPLLHQWLAGELSLALAALFPEISACAELLPAAGRALSNGLKELLDGEGMQHRRYLAVQQPLVACWTRMRMLGASLDEGCWNDEAESQYSCAVREMLRLARRDGRSIFADEPIERRLSASTAGFFAVAVEVSDDTENQCVLRKVLGKSLTEKVNGDETPAAANHSEWAQVALLRPDWKRSSPQLGIAYGDRAVRGELVIDRDRLFAGDWRFAMLVDHKEATPVGDWEELCWVSDEDVDYLELQIELTQGLRVQRQLCLARRDRFLFIADAVLANETSSLRHTLHLPLATGAAATPAGDSREVLLEASQAEALVFPLALPEWRIDPRGGELAVADGAMELRQSATGKALYAPLWIDLDPSRHKKSFTWRQLAVAEERVNVPRDVAAGYRVQFGKKQWLIYRSLTPARNRTVLGHNLATEFLVARFGRDGRVKSLIEVE